MWTVDRGQVVRREIQEQRLKVRQAKTEIRELIRLYGALPPPRIRRHIAKLARKAAVAEGHVRRVQQLLNEQRFTQEP